MNGLLKRGLVFCIKSTNLVEVLKFGGVGFIKVRVGIIKVEFFVEIVFSYKPLTLFGKKFQLRCFTGSIRGFQKTVFMFC